MAIKTPYTSGDITGSIFEQSIITAPAFGTSLNVATSGKNSATFTAPNTTNACTGVWFYVNQVPTSANLVIKLQQSGVDVATETILNADLRFGLNYARFTTPHTYATTSANAYRFNFAPTTALFSTRISTTGIVWAMDTINITSTLGTTDNMWMGYCNSGGSPIRVKVVGTSTVHGDGADKSTSATSPITVGQAIQICNGAELYWDTAANATLETRGSVIVSPDGKYTREANQSDRSIIAKHVFDCDTANGNYVFVSQRAGNVDGVVSTVGAEVVPWAEFVSGDGTTATPLVVDRATDWIPGEEIVIEGTSYLSTSTEKRFIKTVIDPYTFITSNTAGGAEAGFTSAHVAGDTIGHLSRNSIMAAKDTARGPYFYNNNQVKANTNLDYSQFYYLSFASGVGGIKLKPSALARGSANYSVSYGTAAVSAREGYQFSSKDNDTVNGIIQYLAGSNNAGSGSFALSSCANHTFNDIMLFSSASQNLVLSNSYANTFNNFRAIGNNTSNATVGGAINLLNSGSNTFNNSRIDGNRRQALYLQGNSNTVFNNCTFGTRGNNTLDIDTVTDTSNDVLFNNCLFGSTTLINNHLNQLPGSLLRFHKYQATEDNHRWYTINGVGYSDDDGSGGLRARLNPATTEGLRFEYRIPVNVGEVISVYGKFWCNADFLADGGSTMTAELFLPGSIVADQTVNMTKTTDPNTENAVYRLGLVNTSTVADVAIVRLTAKTTVSTAEAYVDDLNGGTNPISALDIWFQGQPLAFQLSPQTLGDSAAISAAVWGDTANYPAGTKGKIQSDTKLTNLLAMDKLS